MLYPAPGLVAIGKMRDSRSVWSASSLPRKLSGLAGALGLAGGCKSGSKLHALQTLARPRPLPTQMKNSTIKAIATDVHFWVPVVVLILGVLVATSPLTVSDSTSIGTPSDPPAGSEYFSLVNYQYYWGVQESGPIHGSFSDVMVVRAGQWVAVNATAQGATGGFYLPFRNLPTVDIQVIPDAMSYWLFQAPSVPGVYAAPDSEYNGPWFGQDVAALVVLPATGSSSLAQYQSNGGEGDIYNPPVLGANGAFLIVDQEGLFDNSVPGPTLTASPGPVTFQYYIPTSSIGVDSYLVNVTSNDPNGQLNYLAAHNYTLPYRVGIYAINTTGGGLVPVTTMPLRVGSPMNETATLAAGVYVYGLVSPIPYVYNPAGESTWMTGSEQGDIMGMWGILWVSS